MVDDPRRLRKACTIGPLGLLVLLLTAGCGGNSDTTAQAPAEATFARMQKEVFNVSCTSDSCHSSVGRAGDMVLEEGQSWDSLVNHTPSNPVAAADGLMRVMPGRPEKSLLLDKLTSNLSAGEGVSMPYGAAPLPAETVDIVQAWIAAGAPAEGQV